MDGKKKFIGCCGFLTVEASLLIPFVLWLYLLLIFTAFFLYNGCLLTQDAYLLSFRGSFFTAWADGYGEVIYGNLSVRAEQEVNAYLAERSIRLNENGRLPALTAFNREMEITLNETETKVKLTIRGRVTQIPGGKSDITAVGQSAAVSPIAVIRDIRRENE